MGGSFKTTDTVVQAVHIRDFDTGDPITGLTDVVAEVVNPDRTVLLPAVPLTAVAELPGTYKFSILATQRTQIGAYRWQVTSPTANMDQPLSGSFLSGIVSEGAAGGGNVSILVRTRTTHIPIPEAKVLIYNSDGSRVLEYGVTNGDGLVVLLGNSIPGFSLDPGQYRVAIVRALTSFDPYYPITVVGGTNSFVLEGTEIPIPIPPHPDLCLIYGWLYELNANAYANQKFHVNIYQPPRGSRTGVLLGSGSIKVETDAEGYFSFYAVRGYMVRIDIPQASLEAAVLVPDQESIKITDLVKVG